jgi:hypothetical protein
LDSFDSSNIWNFLILSTYSILVSMNFDQYRGTYLE